MPKAGRPPGAQNKVGNEEKEFIKQLLGETRQQYHDYFIELANSTDKAKKARFANIRTELSKMIKKEYDYLHKLNNPYILKAYNYLDDDNAYIMEYCDDDI